MVNQYLAIKTVKTVNYSTLGTLESDSGRKWYQLALLNT